MSDEADDAIDITDVTKTQAWTTAPETIGLALGDETEDWCFEFHDAQDVTWFAGPNPVDVCVTYVRSDIVAELRAANARLAAECDRKQEWIDAVMGQEFWYWEASDESINVIERPQPPAKE